MCLFANGHLGDTQYIMYYVSVFPISLPSDSSRIPHSQWRVLEGWSVSANRLPPGLIWWWQAILSRPVISLVINMCQLLLDWQLSCWLAVQTAHGKGRGGWWGNTHSKTQRRQTHTEDTNVLTEAKLILEMCRIPTIWCCPSSQSIAIAV